MKRPGPNNRFELESLEPRILLSVDGSLASPCDLSDECESEFDTDLLPQIDEIALGDEDRLEENSYQNQTTYDPSQSIDDIFAGLGEDHLIEDDDKSEDANEFEDEDDNSIEFEDEHEQADGFEAEFKDDFDHDQSKVFEGEHEDEDEYDDAASSESDGASYENSVISSHQQDQIVRGLNGLSRVGGVLENFDAFGATFTPTMDRTVGEFIGLVEIFDARLAKPVYDYFNDALDPPDSQGVLQTIEEISGNYDDLELYIDCLNGGVTPGGGVLQFDFKINATRRGEVCAENSAAVIWKDYLVNQHVISLSADLELNCSFGVDLENSNEFFYRVILELDSITG